MLQAVDVVVVGAGLAGRVAARDLRGLGLSVTVPEARVRHCAIHGRGGVGVRRVNVAVPIPLGERAAEEVATALG